MNIVNYNQGKDNARLQFNKNPFAPPQPNRMLISAKSGFGKTSLLGYLLNDVLDWDVLLLAVLNPDQPIYTELIERVNPLLKMVNMKEIDLVTNVADIPTVGKKVKEPEKSKGKSKKLPEKPPEKKEDDKPYFTPENTNIAVFDDIAFDKPAIEKIKQYYVAGRPRNITAITLGQSYIDIHKLIRENAAWIMLGEPQKAPDFDRVYRDNCMINGMKVSKEEFQDMWTAANKPTTNSKKELEKHFFTIDKMTVVPILRYRRDFSDLWNPQTKQFEPWTVEQLQKYMKENGYNVTHV